MITIITPTYNRSHTLPKLYQSLFNQSVYEFEWLIIDDGSTDSTEELIKSYQESSPFEIRYLKKQNGGKHTALNVGFDKANRDWVFIVDSDDWLKTNTIETIIYEAKLLADNFNSISMLKIYTDGSIVGDNFPDYIDTYIDRIVKNVSGDKADVFRKSALKGFSFPEYPTEKFMAESPLFLWLGLKGRTRFINFGGYVCEYLEGGLSDNSIKNRHRCFNSTLFVYETQYKSFEKFGLKARAAVNWWRFRCFKSIPNRGMHVPLIYSPFGVFLYIVDKIKGKTRIL